MKIHIELDDTDIRLFIAKYIVETYGIAVAYTDLPLRVQSKQNYKVHDWEEGRMKIEVDLIRKEGPVP